MSGRTDDPVEALVLAELGEHVAQLAAAVAQLQQETAAGGRPGPDHGQHHGRVGSRGEGSDPPRPWCWPRMTHRQKAERLAELAGWVRDVLFAFPAAQRALPRCWPRHWDAIEELSALYCAWKTAYLWEEASAHETCEYLDRWLPGALDCLAVRLRPCAESTSRTGPGATTPSWSIAASPSCAAYVVLSVTSDSICRCAATAIVSAAR